MKKTTFFALMSALVSTASFAAPTTQGGPDYPGGRPPMRDLVRYDFVCEFGEPSQSPLLDGDRSGSDCIGLASIYTRDYSTLSDPGNSGAGGDNGGYNPGKPGEVNVNRMAVSCRGDGLIYADGARWEFDRQHDELVIMPPGAWNPQIRIAHPMATVADDGGDRRRRYDATLDTGDRRRSLHGSCELNIDNGRGGRPTP